MDSSQGTQSAENNVMICESGNGPVLSSGFWYQLLSEEMMKVVESLGFVFAASRAQCIACCVSS